MNEIHRGDCIKILSQYSKPFADLIFADPPFNIGYEYETRTDNRHPVLYFHWCREWIQTGKRILKPGGSFWVAINDENVVEIASLMKSAGLTQWQWCIWYYTFGVHCETKYGRDHTHLLHFVNGERPKYFQPERIESERQRAGDKRANPKGRVPGNVWQYPRLPGNSKERTGHPCQMPETVMSRIVNDNCPPGGTVVDLFAGSGTTAKVANRLGRNSINCEIEDKYVEMIEKRLTAA